jgi:hypothetical protein
MTIGWNPATDFSTVVDALEAITLWRPGAASGTAIEHAWRFAHAASESVATGGKVVSCDVVWQFEWPSTEADPRPGDWLIDSGEHRWTILSTERLQGLTRWRCTARELSVAFHLDAIVQVELGIWEDLGSGPELTGWQVVHPSLLARVQPHEVTVDDTTTPPSTITVYKIHLSEPLELTGLHRIVTPDGRDLRVVKYEGAERIDVLPIVTARLAEP